MGAGLLRPFVLRYASQDFVKKKLSLQNEMAALLNVSGDRCQVGPALAHYLAS